MRLRKALKLATTAIEVRTHPLKNRVLEPIEKVRAVPIIQAIIMFRGFSELMRRIGCRS
jgi:hypothetical protein